MRILFVEDDGELCAALLPVLQNASYSVDVCPDGEEALLLLEGCGEGEIYDACIFDRLLPSLDGLTLLKRVRAGGLGVPVLMLTALGRTSDKVDGLDAGANDYLTKPFDNRELLARLRAITRKTAAPAAEKQVCGDICLCADGLTLAKGSKTVTLSQREFALLEALCRQPGKVQSRALLLGRVWGPLSDASDASLDNYIHFARRRLATVGSRLRIVTIHGLGYKLDLGDEE